MWLVAGCPETLQSRNVEDIRVSIVFNMHLYSLNYYMLITYDGSGSLQPVQALVPRREQPGVCA
jgi:hypothetical protein